MAKETVWLELDGMKKEVLKSDYIRLKTKDLREFGYSTLTEDEVAASLEKALAGNANDVISMFIDGDLLKDGSNDYPPSHT